MGASKTHPVEIEIKLSASPEMLAKLRRHPQLVGEGEQTATLVTTYFDTVGRRLQRGGAALRIRQQGDHHEQTLKLESQYGASVRRKEWNAPVTGQIPKPSGFPTKARAKLTRLLDGAPLEAVATTRIERTTRRLLVDGSLIEVAFDLGSIEAGGRTEGICELELELIDGQLVDVLVLARKLPIGPELRWSVTSKAERCQALALDLPLVAAHARPVKLAPEMSPRQAFQAIAWNCLEQLLANYPLVISVGDPEALHQTRVAIRRLRAAASLFSSVTRDDAEPVLRAELKAVATGLGPARDLDILCTNVASAAKHSEQDCAELVTHLKVQRDAAYCAAREILATEPFQHFLFEFAVWLEHGNWLANQAEAGGHQSLVSFAAKVLSRRRRKLRRVADRFAELTESERHRLRIDIKKMRYAVGFFASLFHSRSAAGHLKTTTKALIRLQDSLGELNDMAIASTAHDALFAAIEPITAASQAAQLEALLAKQSPSRRKLLKVSERSLAEIADGPAWWKVG